MVLALQPEAVRIDAQAERLAQQRQENQVDEEREHVVLAACDAERQVAKDLTPSAQQQHQHQAEPEAGISHAQAAVDAVIAPCVGRIDRR